MVFCLIFVPYGHYDEPESLPYEKHSICPKGVDVRHEKHLAEHDYMVADRFSVTDIIVGFATNWAVSAKQTADFPHVEAYNARLMARPLCPLNED